MCLSLSPTMFNSNGLKRRGSCTCYFLTRTLNSNDFFIVSLLSFAIMQLLTLLLSELQPQATKFFSDIATVHNIWLKITPKGTQIVEIV